ncbi:monosaccharide ABC transporter membrane protein, CUT2 family [Micromonospora coriariae]|uniref:Monosaccharide ABC transporter membrane protein, CUT2 family n=1 Tax=Micromonospora coriariae TaxID=285665 RepID=A0A1C4VZ45_9ACTN|nr:ABC transporter permease [Micromonospora coriariae]SCE89230.1 monosaccharide ABC transporter membrane protein, CUT2 family [Micromonospora coriariae]
MGYEEAGREGSVEPSSGVPAAVLENVFDDPSQGEPGRDRVGVHLGWEVLLLAGVATLGWLLWRVDSDVLRGDSLRTLLVGMVGLGLLTLAAGVSLRTAAPNLAVGPVAVAAALHYAEQGDQGLAASVGPAVGVAALAGLALALAVVVLHVPGWAASLAGAAGVVVYIERRSAPVLVQGDYDPGRSAGYLFAGFAAVAVLGGLFGAIRAIRRLVGRYRPVTDPARRRGVVAAVVTALALVGSTVLAALAGVLLAANGPGPVTPDPGLDWTVLAIGVALLGGTSAYGRRGGLFGTLLAVGLVTVFQAYALARGWTFDHWTVGGVALGVGLLVTRLVETFGRPRPDSTDAPEPVGDGTISTGWAMPRSQPVDSWPPTLPTPAAPQPVDPWRDPRWEDSPRRWDAGER